MSNSINNLRKPFLNNLKKPFLNNLKKPFFSNMKRPVLSLSRIKPASGFSRWFWYAVNNCSWFSVCRNGSSHRWRMSFKISLFPHEQFLVFRINEEFNNVGVTYVGAGCSYVVFNKQLDLLALMRFLSSHKDNLSPWTKRCVVLLTEAVEKYTSVPKPSLLEPEVITRLEEIQSELKMLQGPTYNYFREFGKLR